MSHLYGSFVGQQYEVSVESNVTFIACHRVPHVMFVDACRRLVGRIMQY